MVGVREEIQVGSVEKANTLLVVLSLWHLTARFYNFFHIVVICKSMSLNKEKLL